VPLDERVHERTERENLKASPARIVERFAHEDRPDPLSLERIIDLRVHEGDQPWLHAVGDEARQSAIDHGFVTLRLWVVTNLYGHLRDATPRPHARRASTMSIRPTLVGPLLLRIDRRRSVAPGHLTPLRRESRIRGAETAVSPIGAGIHMVDRHQSASGAKSGPLRETQSTPARTARSHRGELDREQ